MPSKFTSEPTSGLFETKLIEHSVEFPFQSFIPAFRYKPLGPRAPPYHTA
jgi:hypothetical protein